MAQNKGRDGINVGGFGFSGMLGLMNAFAGGNGFSGQFDETFSHQGSQGARNAWMEKGPISIGNNEFRDSELEYDRHSEFRLSKSVRSNKSDGSLNDREINQAISHKLMFIQQALPVYHT
jgi:hypothetical protein